MRAFLRELSARSQTIDSLRVRFRQEKQLRILRRPRVSEGEVLYANGRLLMTTRSAAGEIESQLHVEDGVVRLYYPELELAEVLPARAEGAGAAGAGSASESGLLLPLVDGRWEALLDAYRVELSKTRVGIRPDGSIVRLEGEPEAEARRDGETRQDGKASRSDERASAGESSSGAKDPGTGSGSEKVAGDAGEGEVVEKDAVVLNLVPKQDGLAPKEDGVVPKEEGVVPKEEGAKVLRVRATFVDHQPRELFEEHRAGHRMRMEILEWSTGVRVADRDLRLTLPPGTRVVHLAPQ